jgi:hypothetical protein
MLLIFHFGAFFIKEAWNRIHGVTLSFVLAHFLHDGESAALCVEEL